MVIQFGIVSKKQCYAAYSGKLSSLVNYLSNYDKNLLMILILTLTSCNNLKVDCEVAAKEERKSECLLIFESLPVFGQRSLNPQGKNIETNEDCECKDVGSWWAKYENYIEKGDTIIKKKGELVFSIHKKDTVLNFNWECEGKVYK